MGIGITSDHAAHDLHIDLTPRLREPGYDVVNREPTTSECTDCAKWGMQLAREVAAVRFGVGIAICGPGIDILIATNKIKGIRAACVSEAYSAAMSRRHNGANVLCFGSRVVGSDVVPTVCEASLEAFFEDGRHTGRVAQLRQLDAGGVPFPDEGCRRGLGYGPESDFRGRADSITRIYARIINLGAGPLM